MLTHFDIVTLQPGMFVKGFALVNSPREILKVKQCGETVKGKTFAHITVDSGTDNGTISGCVAEGDDIEIWFDWQVDIVYNEERNECARECAAEAAKCAEAYFANKRG